MVLSRTSLIGYTHQYLAMAYNFDWLCVSSPFCYGPHLHQLCLTRLDALTTWSDPSQSCLCKNEWTVANRAIPLIVITIGRHDVLGSHIYVNNGCTKLQMYDSLFRSNMH